MWRLCLAHDIKGPGEANPFGRMCTHECARSLPIGPYNLVFTRMTVPDEMMSKSDGEPSKAEAETPGAPQRAHRARVGG